MCTIFYITNFTNLVYINNLCYIVFCINQPFNFVLKIIYFDQWQNNIILVSETLNEEVYTHTIEQVHGILWCCVYCLWSEEWETHKIDKVTDTERNVMGGRTRVSCSYQHTVVCVSNCHCSVPGRQLWPRQMCSWHSAGWGLSIQGSTLPCTAMQVCSHRPLWAVSSPEILTAWAPVDRHVCQSVYQRSWWGHLDSAVSLHVTISSSHSRMMQGRWQKSRWVWHQLEDSREVSNVQNHPVCERERERKGWEGCGMSGMRV